MASERFAEIIYNSIFVISILNFLNIYISPIILVAYTSLYNFRYTNQIIFTCLCSNFVYNNITKNGKEIVCYTSSIHASILAFCSILKLGNILNVYFYDLILDYSVVYNLFDIVYLLYYNSKIKNQMIFHHTVVISTILYKSWYPLLPNYYYYVALNYLSEITTVPLNVTWLLHLKKKKECSYVYNCKHNYYCSIYSFQSSSKYLSILPSDILHRFIYYIYTRNVYVSKLLLVL